MNNHYTNPVSNQYSSTPTFLEDVIKEDGVDRSLNNYNFLDYNPQGSSQIYNNNDNNLDIDTCNIYSNKFELDYKSEKGDLMMYDNISSHSFDRNHQMLSGHFRQDLSTSDSSSYCRLVSTNLHDQYPIFSKANAVIKNRSNYKTVHMDGVLINNLLLNSHGGSNTSSNDSKKLDCSSINFDDRDSVLDDASDNQYLESDSLLSSNELLKFGSFLKATVNNESETNFYHSKNMENFHVSLTFSLVIKFYL